MGMVECGEWLRDNTPEGSHVFLFDFASFPHFFFVNRHNVYTVGLDNAFMKYYDEELFALYQDVLSLRKDPYPIIKNTFNASYVNVHDVPLHAPYFNYFAQNPDKFKFSYTNGFCYIFEVT